MATPRFCRACLIGLFLLLAWPGIAQTPDTTALRAKVDSLQNEAAGFVQQGDFQNATERYLEAARICETYFVKNDKSYANCLNGLGICSMYGGDFDRAIGYHEKALAIRKELLGENHPDYAASLNNIGNTYLVARNARKALGYLTEALEIRRQALGELHPDYAASLNGTGACYWELGDYEKSIEYGEKAAETFLKIVGDKHPSYGICLNNMALRAKYLGDYGNAITYLTKASNAFAASLGEQHPYNAACLNNLALCYHALGNYEKAIEYFSKALDINRTVYGEIHPDYARNLDGLANSYRSVGDYGLAIQYHEKALEIRREIFGENNMDYAASLINLALCYEDCGDLEKAIEYQKRGVVCCREALGEHHFDYAECLYILACIYEDYGELEQSFQYFSQALEIRRETVGEFHEDYAHNLIAVGSIFYRLGERDSTATYFRACSPIASKLVLEAFTYLPQSQRSMFWNKFNTFFTDWLPKVVRFLPEDKPYLCTVYDGALFSKGLLLNAETALRQLILESDDEDALALYNRLLMERMLLDQQRTQPAADRTMPLDSLETVCETLEQELQQKSRAFGDYTKNLTVTWKDVQAALRKEDIAIEFLEIPVAEDTTVYGALTLKQGYDAPHFIELFDLKDLEALRAKYAGRPHSEGLVIEDGALYDMVWKPLEGELKGTKNVFFGPSGELYHIAIEYAAGGKRPVIRKKNIYRLSSTRQLAVERGVAERSRSAVFGGLKYGASEEVLLADSRKYTQRSLPEDVFFHIDSLDIRGAGGGLMVADLPGTETEALEIDALLRKEGLDNTLRMGEEGTEAAFKDLSGRRENIIHIATHGFYWNGHQASRINERLGRSLDDGAGRLQEDASMTRSGLLFTGANNTLRGRENKEGVDDGILTAKEIAQMDLRGTDLLVLSACQTGLGEVSGEGVFGLQRGFKKAGVNTILMSLWEVDDEATSLLMTSFYKALAKGLSKADALKAAQKAVKNYKAKDFSSPYYWAAFILLDGD